MKNSTFKTFKSVLGILLVFALLFASIPGLRINAQASEFDVPDVYPIEDIAHIIEFESAEVLETIEDILWSASGTPIGMHGFEGLYAIDSIDEIIEIIVQFDMPPAVALRLMQEHGMSMEISNQSSMEISMQSGSFEEQALTAHASFRQQLSQLSMTQPESLILEIFSEHHSLFNGVYMRLPGGMVEHIASLPGVYGVFPNVVYSTSYEPITDAETIGIEAIIDQDLLREARDLFDIDYIHNVLGYTGAGVQVAVIDSGIDHGHPEFANYLDGTGKIPGWGFWHDYTPVHWHGTAVSGAVIAIAPDIALYNYRINVSGGGGGGTPIGAIEAAHADGADVINMSFGSPGVSHPYTPISSAINLAVMDGVVCVASAGNSGSGLYTLTSPGPEPLLITAGAGIAGGKQFSVLGDNVADFSSRGPVRETYHIKPDIIAPGRAIYTTQMGGSYNTVDGTSFSAPIVSGVAALMLEAFPGAAPQEIKARIMNTARPLSVSGANNVYSSGAGFIQPIEALTSQSVVYAEQLVPISNTPAAPHDYRYMASLSYGAINSYYNESMNESITLHIENNGSASKTYTINHSFVSNPSNAAALSFSNSGITIGSGSIGQLTATMVIGSSAPIGFYEGFITVDDGSGNTVARLPFAAVVMETVTVQLSDEAALRNALSTAGSTPTIIEIASNITLVNPAGSLIIPSGSQITLKGVGGTAPVITASGSYAVIQVASGAQLTLEGVDITRISGTNGRGITNLGSLTLIDGVISGHSLSAYVVSINDERGAGIFNQGILTMDGGEISNNTAAGNGGGVFNNVSGVFVMHGGTINTNSATNGGGVYNATSFSLDAGEIHSNSATNDGGGIQNYGIFEMSGGIINNNSAASSGGGISIYPIGTLTMSSGIIDSNSANNGGGVFNWGNLTINGGVISNNSATNNGGGIGINNSDLTSGNLLIDSNAVFSGNSANTPRDSHAYPAYSTHIQCTRWTDPFLQGVNNYDITSTGSAVTLRTLSFELNGTVLDPTDPETIDPIRFFNNTAIMDAPKFPANPTRIGYTFGGWYLDSGLGTLVEASTLRSVDTTIYASWSTLVPETTPSATIDYATEELDSLVANADYILNGTNIAADAAGRYSITSLVPANGESPLGLSIIKVGDGLTTTDSIAQTDLSLAPRPAVPTPSHSDCTTPLNDDGEITGVTTAMEFSSDGGATWTSATGTTIGGLSNGTYIVRVRYAAGVSFASEPATVTISAYTASGTAPSIPSAAGNDVINVDTNTLASGTRSFNVDLGAGSAAATGIAGISADKGLVSGSLTSGTYYTYNAGTVTLTNAYLLYGPSVANSPVTLTVTFNDAASTTGTVTINVINSNTGNSPNIYNNVITVDPSILASGTRTFTYYRGTGASGASGVVSITADAGSVSTLAVGTHYTHNQGVVTLTNAYLSSLTTSDSPIALTVVLNDIANTTGKIMIYVTDAITGYPPSINANGYENFTIDLYTLAAGSRAFGVNLGAGLCAATDILSISANKGAVTNLTPGTHYSYSSGNVTLTNAYLNSLTVADSPVALAVTFNDTANTTGTLTVYVTNLGTAPSISSIGGNNVISVDLYTLATGNRTFNVNLGAGPYAATGIALISADRGIVSALVAGTHYSYSTNTVTLTNAYLASLAYLVEQSVADNPVTLTVTFNNSANTVGTVTINVTDSDPGTVPNIPSAASNDVITVDTYSLASGTRAFDVYLGVGASAATGITSISADKGAVSGSLTSGTHYAYSAGTVTLTNAYLATLTVADNPVTLTVTFNDTAGTTGTVTINVTNLDQGTPPSITSSSSISVDVSTLGTNTRYFNFNLGTGPSAATGIASITADKGAVTNLTSGTHYTIGVTQVTLTNAYLATLAVAYTPVTLTVTFNDSANTSVTVTINVFDFSLGSPPQIHGGGNESISIDLYTLASGTRTFTHTSGSGTLGSSNITSIVADKGAVSTLTAGTHYTHSAGTVTLTNAYLSSLTVADSPVALTVTFGNIASSTGTVTIYITNSNPNTVPGIHSAADNNVISVDIHTLATGTRSFDVYLGTGSSVAAGIADISADKGAVSGSLTLGMDYSYSAGTVTLTNAYLSSLTVSNSPVTLTVTFDDVANTTGTITINVIDSALGTAPSIIGSNIIPVDLYVHASGTRVFIVDLGTGFSAATGIAGISADKGAVTNLLSGTHYTFNAGMVTLTSAYLSSLAVIHSPVTLTVAFDDIANTTRTLTIIIMDSNPGTAPSIPSGAGNNIIDIDLYLLASGTRSFTVDLGAGSSAATGIRYITTNKGAITNLISGTHYTFGSSMVTLTNAYLSSLVAADNPLTLTVTFNNTANTTGTVTINVTNSDPSTAPSIPSASGNDLISVDIYTLATGTRTFNVDLGTGSLAATGIVGISADKGAVSGSLSSGTHYAFSIGTVTLTNAYLASLAVADSPVSLTITFNDMANTTGMVTIDVTDSDPGIPSIPSAAGNDVISIDIYTLASATRAFDVSLGAGPRSEDVV